MTDDKNHTDVPGEERPSDTGVIIDATGHGRPHVRDPEPDRQKGGADLAFLKEIPLAINVVLAETTIPLGEVLALETDSILQLDRASGDPVDIYVENQKLGRGEVMVLHEKLRIRILEVTPPRGAEKPDDAVTLEGE